MAAAVARLLAVAQDGAEEAHVSAQLGGMSATEVEVDEAEPPPYHSAVSALRMTSVGTRQA